MSVYEQMPDEMKKEFYKKVMDEANAEFIEEPIAAKDATLAKFADTLKKKGFNFDPKEICKLIDQDAKEQFAKLYKDSFAGIGPERLADIKAEVIQWFQNEDERFGKFRDFKIQEAKDKLEQICKQPSNEVVVPIKGRKKKEK